MPEPVALTARQFEIATLLAQGWGLAAIRERLHMAEQTCRQHILAIDALLRAAGWQAPSPAMSSTDRVRTWAVSVWYAPKAAAMLRGDAA